MKKVLAVLALLAAAVIVTACGSGLRNGTYEFRSANVPRGEFGATENIWVAFSEHDNGITVDGDRIRSGGGGWYYFQVVNNVVEVRRSAAASWTTTPYRVRGSNFTIEFGDGARVVRLRRR
jgi:hypothetical protein